MFRAKAWFSALVLVLAFAPLASCADETSPIDAVGGASSAPGGDAGAGGQTAALPEAYVFASSVTDGETANTYVVVMSELGGDVDISKGLEVPGYPAVFAELGWVFISDSEKLTVTRYDVDAENRLTNPERFSLAGEGVATLDGLTFFVFDRERAYYIDSQGQQIIVWNPSTMEIIDAVPILDLERNGFQGIARGGNAASTWLVKDKGVLYLPVFWSNSDALTADPSIGLLSISATDATEQALYTNDCAAMSDEGMLLGLDENLYLAGTNGWTMFSRFGNASNLPETGIAKFDMSSQSFRSDYCQSIPELTGGHDAGTLIAYAPGKFLVRAVDDSLATISDSDTFYADIENACRFYQGDIDADGNLTVEEQPALGTTPHYCWGWVYNINGEPYFWGEDTMFRWSGTKMEPVFTSTGYATGFQRIR